jgi:hypothetical protein
VAVVLHGDDAMRRARVARRIGVVGGVLICVLLSVSAASAHSFAPRKPAVTAVDARTGKHLPANPVLHHGDRVILIAPGFAGRTRVVVALVGVRHLATVRSDGRGVVRYAFTVASRLHRGRHTFIFSGPAPPTHTRPGQPSPSRPRRDRQTLMVTVPYDPPWPFRLGGGSGTAGQGGHRGDQHHPTGGPPAGTGTDLLPLVVIGSAALVLGIAALRASRRRIRREDGDVPPSPHPPDGTTR